MPDLIETNAVVERSGVHVSKDVSGETVWDALAGQDPLHAVISAESEEAAEAKSERQIAEIMRHLSSETTILDLGCGYGRLAEYLLPKAQIGCYVGVDGSYAMLQLFRKWHEESPVAQSAPLICVNCDIGRVPVKSDSIDLIVVSAVFLHNHKSVVGPAMAEVQRMLKKGGELLVFSSFPRRASLMGLQGVLHQMYLNLAGSPMRNGPVRYYSRGEVERLLTGFSSFRLVPSDYAILPKSWIGWRGRPERIYRQQIANPVNALVERFVPERFLPAFSRHYDVLAIK